MKKLNEILGTEFPMIQGGMANIATGEFAAACSNAGALGMIATGGWDGARLRQEIHRAKELTDKPFGVNLMLMSPYAVDLPVVAAGGIADGRQAAAAFALGACGIQIGTCLLASEECPIHENYKKALLKAKDSDTVVTGRSVGGPVRVLKNKMSRAYLAEEKRGATLEELEQLTLGGLRRAVLEGDMERGSVMCGQVAGMLHEVRPVRTILEELYSGAKSVLAETEQVWRERDGRDGE